MYIISLGIQLIHDHLSAFCANSIRFKRSISQRFSVLPYQRTLHHQGFCESPLQLHFASLRGLCEDVSISIPVLPCIQDIRALLLAEVSE